MSRPRNGPPGLDFPKEQFFFWRHDPGVGPLPAQNDPNDPKNTGWKLEFEAHITSLSDSSSPSWNDYYDMGRADPKVFYTNTTRTLNIGFMIIAMNDQEHIDNTDSMEKLGLMTYPLYKSSLGYNAPHVYYNIGFLHGGYGIITNLDYTWNMQDHPWINSNPVITDVSMTIRMLADINGKRPSTKSRYFK